MANRIRRCAVMAIAAFSFLLVLAPSAYARFPVRFPFNGAVHPFSPVQNLRGNIRHVESNIFRDRSRITQDLRTHNEPALRRDLGDLRRDESHLAFDRSVWFGLWSMGPHGNYPFTGTMNGYGNGGYGNSGYGSGGYGGGYGGGGSPMSAATPVMTTQAPQTSEANVFDVLGLPNSNGHVDWPLGLRVLPPESRELRLQIEGLLLAAAGQGGRPQLVAETGRAVDKLRGLMADMLARDRLSPSTSAEAVAFMNRLDDALKILK